MRIYIPTKESKQSVCSVPFTAKQGLGTFPLRSYRDPWDALVTHPLTPSPPHYPLLQIKENEIKNKMKRRQSLYNKITASPPQGRVREHRKRA